MQQLDEEVIDEIILLCKVFRIPGTTLWAFRVGRRHEEDIKVLASFGKYQTKKEAQLAASSFVSGMKFAIEILNQ